MRNLEAISHEELFKTLRLLVKKRENSFSHSSRNFMSTYLLYFPHCSSCCGYNGAQNETQLSHIGNLPHDQNLIAVFKFYRFVM